MVFPNGRQQFSLNRGGFQSPNFRDQGRGQSQYQGQNKGFMPSSERPLTQMSPGKEHLNGKGSEQMANIWSRMKEAN